MTAACSGLVPASANAAATHSHFRNFATGYLHAERQARFEPRPCTVSVVPARVKPSRPRAGLFAARRPPRAAAVCRAVPPIMMVGTDESRAEVPAHTLQCRTRIQRPLFGL